MYRLGTVWPYSKPEVEEIPSHVEGRSLGENRVEEAEQIALAGSIGFGGAVAQVGVRDKIGAIGARALRVQYKGRGFMGNHGPPLPRNWNQALGKRIAT